MCNEMRRMQKQIFALKFGLLVMFIVGAAFATLLVVHLIHDYHTFERLFQEIRK